MKGWGRYAQDNVGALDEWEELALHLGLSVRDKTIQELRRLSGGHSLRRKAMVSR